MYKLFIFLSISLFVISGCSKMEDKKSGTQNTPQMNQQMPPNMNGSPHSQDPENQKPGQNDAKANELSEAANNFEKEYGKAKTDANKKKLIDLHLEAGKYMVPLEGEVHSMGKSIRIALKHYNRVLQLDPKNSDAELGKKKIQEMYDMIGMPLPTE